MLLGSDLPIQVAGKDTQEVGGLGELTYDEYKERLKRSHCYLHLGTIPAPYTLTLVEAACSGTPIIAMDKGSGRRGEGFGLPLACNAEGAVTLIREMLANERIRRQAHNKSRLLAGTAFCGKTVRLQWASLLRDIKEVSNESNGGNSTP